MIDTQIFTDPFFYLAVFIGVLFVYGCSRVPSPAAKIIALIKYFY